MWRIKFTRVRASIQSLTAFRFAVNNSNAMDACRHFFLRTQSNLTSLSKLRTQKPLPCKPKRKKSPVATSLHSNGLICSEQFWRSPLQSLQKNHRVAMMALQRVACKRNMRILIDFVTSLLRYDVTERRGIAKSNDYIEHGKHALKLGRSALKGTPFFDQVFCILCTCIADDSQMRVSNLAAHRI